MKRIATTVKYVIHDSLRPIVIFYLVIVLLVLLFSSLTITMTNWHFEFDGLRLATTIFLLVAGLNSFKSGYLFLQANGVTRRHFYAGGLLAICAMAAGMTAIDAMLYGLLNLIVPVSQQLSPDLYPHSGYVGSLMWTLAFNLLAAAFGWFVTMLYYRMGKGLKIAVSISPAAMLIGLILISDATGGKLLEALANTFSAVMGLGDRPSVWLGALTMLIAAAVAFGLCFLLVRRAPIKEQDR